MPPSIDKDAASPRVSSHFPFRVFGVLLLAAAILLHVRQTGAERSRDIGARKVRESVSAGVIGMGLRATPEDGERERIFEPCSHEVASNLLSRLASAEPTREKPPVQARSYDLFLLLASRSRAYMRVLRAPGADEAFVALRSVQVTGAPPVELDCLPARVEGLGALFDELDAGGDGLSLREAKEVPTLSGWQQVGRRSPGVDLSEAEAASTAASLRAMAQKQVTALGAMVGGKLADGKVPISLILEPALGEALRTFATAEDEATPKSAFDGTPCTLIVFLKERIRLSLMVAIPDDSPQDALVGFVEPVSVSGEQGTIGGGKFSVSSPAKVRGLGAVLAPALNAMNKTSVEPVE